jgi:hypothetical protein
MQNPLHRAGSTTAEVTPPMQIRAFARRLRNDTVRAIKQRVLRHAVASLGHALRTGRQPSPRLFEQLVYGWGNEAWSARSSFLQAVIEWLPRTTGSVVECGPGISTFVLASAAAVSARRVHAFEHNRDWAERIVRELPSDLRASVEMHLTPIRSCGDFDWYSLDALTLPSDVGFVVCDGPPGKTRGGRYGLAPMLRAYLKPGCIVLLDDTQRLEERQIVRRWCDELPASVIETGENYNVVSIGENRPPVGP